jgi:hypothetical protein
MSRRRVSTKNVSPGDASWTLRLRMAAGAPKLHPCPKFRPKLQRSRWTEWPSDAYRTASYLSDEYWTGDLERCRHGPSSRRGHCPHCWLQTRRYWGWSGTDSACFRGLALLSTPRMQFESHLGHANPLVRGVFCFNVCTKLWPNDSDDWFAGFGLAVAMAYSGVWVRGSVPCLVGLPPAAGWDQVVPRSGAVGLGGSVQHHFMVWGDGYYMTFQFRARIVAKESLNWRGEPADARFVLPAGVDSVNTYDCGPSGPKVSRPRLPLSDPPPRAPTERL